ncbi:hypothetical protein HMPREF9244_00895 [Alloscardovia omnicolens F0580]|uniref:Uncharacterized protein n=1 Tax=Alloscardovia omnicolens F0580 TaxID=1321816 RepID=U1SJY0_9BIFI|nr:hypothetical protein HMPREF9244_00895 [Alloscardovia omnicolens F0580]
MARALTAHSAHLEAVHVVLTLMVHARNRVDVVLMTARILLVAVVSNALIPTVVVKMVKSVVSIKRIAMVTVAAHGVMTVAIIIVVMSVTLVTIAQRTQQRVVQTVVQIVVKVSAISEEIIRDAHLRQTTISLARILTAL